MDMNATTGHQARTITLRCTTTAGHDLAEPVTINLASTFQAAALTAIIGDRASGALSATAFASAAFNATVDYQDQSGLRARVVLRHLCALDALALTAVRRDIPAIITWN
jgi:hypothetical protein